MNWIYKMMCDFILRVDAFMESLKPKRKLAYMRKGRLVWKDCPCQDCEPSNAS